MEMKKVTYNLPITVINQISKLKEKTGKSKSKIISDLVKSTMSPEDKILSKNIAKTLPQIEKFENNKMTPGSIILKEKTDAVKLKNSIYLDKSEL
jgi:metal-responsive CopG/Arc/MetJ family transcriptional regulator